ncbi:MAG: PaaI family thioesterase [Chloroflexi bacterium]|nr:PaaI family thioesterase [Chloroflexota bacterium]
MGADFYLQADGSVVGLVTLAKDHEGPPFHVHGGVLAALIDEAMGAACWSSGKRVVAVNLNFNYRRPVPLAVALRVTGHIAGSERRKTFTTGAILLPDGTAAVEGSGIFVEAPQIFAGLANPFARLPEDGG